MIKLPRSKFGSILVTIYLIIVVALFIYSNYFCKYNLPQRPYNPNLPSPINVEAIPICRILPMLPLAIYTPLFYFESESEIVSLLILGVFWLGYVINAIILYLIGILLEKVWKKYQRQK